MIIKTLKGTYYVRKVLEENEDTIVISGFKNIKSIEKITLRKTRLKKSSIVERIDLNKEIIFIKNDDGDIRRLFNIELLLELNKDSIKYVPCTYREFIKIYNTATRKYKELK